MKHLEKILVITIMVILGFLIYFSRPFLYGMFILYFAITAIFAVRASLIILYRKKTVHLEDVPSGAMPKISVIIPMRDEEKVVDSLFTSMNNLRYPPTKKELVFIADACNDKTAERLISLISDHGFEKVSNNLKSEKFSELLTYSNHEGVSVKVVIRDKTIGGRGKSASLNAGLSISEGEIVGFYDADHIPARDCLLRVGKIFSMDKDHKIGCIQGPCYVRNAKKNFLTSLVFLEYINLNRMEQTAKSNYNGMTCFEGSNGFFRVEAIERAGGFDPNNLAEDTYISYKLVEKGYKIEFDPQTRSFELAPVSWRVWYRQRLRWARGWFQCMNSKLFRFHSDSLTKTVEGNYLLLQGLQNIIVMVFICVYPAVRLLLFSLYYFGIFKTQTFVDIWVDISFATAFGLLVFFVPILETTVSIITLREEFPSYMESTENKKGLILFPIYSILMGIVTFGAFVEQYILRKQVTWIKTKRQ